MYELVPAFNCIDYKVTIVLLLMHT